MSREEVYGLTGIQVMNFNSLYQLYAMKRDNSPPLKAAVRALFMPDALSYMLTGKMVTEYTIASTSQILNPRTKKMEEQLLEKMGVKGSLFGEVVPTGTVIGTLTDALATETGIGKVPVVAVAGHDTASAVAAVPAADEKFAYLSSCLLYTSLEPFSPEVFQCTGFSCALRFQMLAKTTNKSSPIFLKGAISLNFYICRAGWYLLRL